MHSGKVKLYVDLNEFIIDEDTLFRVNEYEAILIEAQ